MATYCIGDLHGCLQPLKALLQIVQYDLQQDVLWFTGDLVNRGPKSLEVLRLLRSLPRVKVVLGNHDLHLISLYYRTVNFNHQTLQPVLQAADASQLIDWLRGQPLILYNKKADCLLTHAGIYPHWSLDQALGYAEEVQQGLRSDQCANFLQNLYGDHPHQWNENLQGKDRYRFIVNTLTRMRFCDLAGNLEFKHTGNLTQAPQGYQPWFTIPQRKIQTTTILFGHWATLNGETRDPQVIALDTGCAWGNRLTAIRLEDRKIFSVPATA